MTQTEIAREHAARQLDQERSVIDSVARTLGPAGRPPVRHRFSADRADTVYRQITTLWTPRAGGLAQF
jgi:hypothetical protein